jgi:hypothetical protein
MTSTFPSELKASITKENYQKREMLGAQMVWYDVKKYTSFITRQLESGSAVILRNKFIYNV